MKIKLLLLTFTILIPFLYGQHLYPDSAVVIGYSHHVYATGEVSGNRVMVRDSNDHIHAVYGYAMGGPFTDTAAIYYVFSGDNGLSWSVPYKISQSDSHTAIEPNIAIDSRDRLHCVWKQLLTDTSTTYYDYDMYYSRKDSAGWTRPINISNQGLGANACYSSMAVDSRNYVHVVWDMSTSWGMWDIFYSFYNDTAWSDPIPLSTSAYDDAFPSLSVDRNDDLHVVWRQRTNTAPIYYTKRQNQSWSTPEIIASFSGGQSAYPCIAVDYSNYPNVVFQHSHFPSDSGSILHISSNGSSWSPPVSISNTIHPTLGPSLAIDSQDIIYCVWTERVINPGPNSDLFISMHRGANWTTPINITQDTNTSRCPKLCYPIKNGRLDLTWTSSFSYPPETYEVVYLGFNISGNIHDQDLSCDEPLLAIFPNPFSNTVTLRTISTERPYNISIYDVSGRLVNTMVMDLKGRCDWNGKDLTNKPVAPGIYFLKWKGGKRQETYKIIRIK